MQIFQAFLQISPNKRQFSPSFSKDSFGRFVGFQRFAPWNPLRSPCFGFFQTFRLAPAQRWVERGGKLRTVKPRKLIIAEFLKPEALERIFERPPAAAPMTSGRGSPQDGGKGLGKAIDVPPPRLSERTESTQAGRRAAVLPIAIADIHARWAPAESRLTQPFSRSPPQFRSRRSRGKRDLGREPIRADGNRQEMAALPA